MGCGIQQTQIKVEPMKVFWGREHCRNYVFTGTGANSGGDYFELHVYNQNYEYTPSYIWLDDGVASDPAPSGLANLGSVSILAGDTSAQIVAKILLAFPLSLGQDVIAKAGEASNEFCFCNKYIGAVVNEGLGTVSATKAIEVEGIGGELGATSGGVELAFEQQTFEVKSDQTGELLLADISLGQSASASMTLIELVDSVWKSCIAGVAGNSHTPSGGTEVIGFGQSKLYQSLINYAGKLILHPVRIEDVSDHTDDWCFWLSAPLPESISFSGTEAQGMSVTFKAYLDKSKDSKVNMFVKGDWTQDIEA